HRTDEQVIAVCDHLRAEDDEGVAAVFVYAIGNVVGVIVVDVDLDGVGRADGDLAIDERDGRAKAGAVHVAGGVLEGLENVAGRSVDERDAAFGGVELFESLAVVGRGRAENPGGRYEREVAIDGQ